MCSIFNANAKNSNSAFGLRTPAWTNILALLKKGTPCHFGVPKRLGRYVVLEWDDLWGIGLDADSDHWFDKGTHPDPPFEEVNTEKRKYSKATIAI